MRVIKNRFAISLMLLLIFLSVSCGGDPQTTKEMEQAAAELRAAATDAGKELATAVGSGLQSAKRELSAMRVGDQQVSELAEGELERLFTIEYQVLELSASAELSAVQEALTTAGRDRWDCYHQERVGDKQRIYCKRQAKSYLRYIARGF